MGRTNSVELPYCDKGAWLTIKVRYLDASVVKDALSEYVLP